MLDVLKATYQNVEAKMVEEEVVKYQMNVGKDINVILSALKYLIETSIELNAEQIDTIMEWLQKEYDLTDSISIVF